MNVQLWQTEGRGQVIGLTAPFPKATVQTRRGLLGSIPSAARFDLHGKAIRLLAWVGLRSPAKCKAVFSVLADGQEFFRSDSLVPDATPLLVDLDLTGKQNLELLVDAGWATELKPSAYWADARIVVQPLASYPQDQPVIIPFLNETDAPAVGEIFSRPYCALPKTLAYRPGQIIRQRLMVTGPKPISVKVVGLPAGITHDPETQTLNGRIENTGNYPFTIVVNAGGTTLKHYVTLQIGLAPPPQLPLRGWVSPRLLGPILRQTDVQQAGMGLINSGLADLGFDWLVIGEGWQGLRAGRYHALQPNERFKELSGLINKSRQLGLKAGLWLSTERYSASGYIGTHADTWIGALKDEFNGMPRGKFSFAAEDVKQWNEWRVDGLWLYGSDLETADVAIYNAQMAKALPTRLLSLEHNKLRPTSLKLASGQVQQQLFESSTRPTDSWFVLRQQILAATKSLTPDLPLTGRLILSEPIGMMGPNGQLIKGRRSRLSAHTRRLQFGLYALLGLPLWLQDNPLWLLKHNPNDLYWLTNQEVLALQRDHSPVATCAHWDQQHQTGIWTRHLENGSTVIGWLNLTGQVQTIPFRVTGNFAVHDLWRHEAIGDVPATGEISCEVAPYGLELWLLTPIKARVKGVKGKINPAISKFAQIAKRKVPTNQKLKRLR